jgi:hypothetical protein
MFGVELFRQRPQHHYVPDYYGRSAGKHLDIRTLQPFAGVADEVIREGKTLLYYDRLYVHYQALSHIMRVFSDGTGIYSAEVGVYKGGGSKFIFTAAQALGTRLLQHYGFDTFEGHHAVDINSRDTFHKPGYFGDTAYEAVVAYLRPYTGIKLIKGRFQEQTAIIEQLPFHFVHLDVDILEPTAFALGFFHERLVQSGVIIVDDYGFSTCPGVRQAVDDFVRGHPGYFFSHELTGQAILIKICD